MDSILFVPSVAASEWVCGVLPATSPVDLPVAGRGFIDYALESSMKSGFKRAGVLDWHFDEQRSDSREKLATGCIPCISLKGTGPLPRGLNDLERVATPFTNPIRDGMAVVWGLCLTGSTVDVTSLEPLGDGECADTPMGLYYRESGRWMRIRLDCLVARDVRSWYEMNFAVLGNSRLFTLPGYSSEENIHLGRNVVLEHGAQVVPPAIVQDGAWCARNVRLNGNVIVGKGSFVGEGAQLERTIVVDNTYVGKGLELVDKIVAGRRIIDSRTGAWTDVDESGLARSIGMFGMGWLSGLWKFLQGTSRGRHG